MDNFIFPSDADRAENEELDRVCEYLEEVLEEYEDNSASVAAIQFALETDEGMKFLRCWNHGDFDAICNGWPEAPEEVFIGADPLHKTNNSSL